MEKQFEVRYLGSFQMMLEFYKKSLLVVRVIQAIVCTSLWLYYVGVSIRDGILFFMFPALLLMGLLFVLLWFMPHGITWLTLYRAKKQYEGIVPETVVTFADMIQMSEGMVQITVEYRKIVRVERWKHSYMLMTGKRNGIMLDPNGFTQGTFEEFKQFLREKRPDLTIPD